MIAETQHGSVRPVIEESFESVKDWFSAFGVTDSSYLQGHFDRFIGTRAFALNAYNNCRRLNVLDIGCHWLHNAFFYYNSGHDLICVDASQVVELPEVRACAAAMGARLIYVPQLETAAGFSAIESDSVDLVLFCEIIEHITFNPVCFWKEVYRVLKPGGHIIVTTPNSLYHASILRDVNDIIAGRRVGTPVSDILKIGTYGHHWKEFSLCELQEYFSILSPDFGTGRYAMVYVPGDRLPDHPIVQQAAMHSDVLGREIYLDVTLKSKDNGISAVPLW